MSEKFRVKSDQHSKSFQTEKGLNLEQKLEKRSEFFRPFLKVSEKVPLGLKKLWQTGQKKAIGEKVF